MPKIVNTESGTKYRIDLENKTWERLSKTEQSGYLRSDSGVFYRVENMVVGSRMSIVRPQINQQSIGRVICTSVVVAVEDDRPENGQTR